MSPYHVDSSANNVLCRGGHFCEIAGVLAHIISSQVQLEQENSLNSLKRYPSIFMARRIETFRAERNDFEAKPDRPDADRDNG